MKPERSLPILLVSACTKATAEEFISELIDNEVSEPYSEAERGGGRVWRLVNKYYSADVLVRARADAEPWPPGRVEAHVAYFTPEECAASAEAVVSCAERRAAGGADGAAVRVAALRAARAGALAGWAARVRCEPVPLLDPAEGTARVRDALHAHVWPGLTRRDRPDSQSLLSYPDSEESSSCGSDVEGEGEGEGEGEEVDVERAEQFALALGALGELGRGAGRAGGAGSDAERRQRAEHLLEAFCRALGEPLDL